MLMGHRRLRYITNTVYRIDLAGNFMGQNIRGIRG